MKQLQHTLLLMITACGLAVLWGCPPQEDTRVTEESLNNRVVKTTADVRALDTVTHILGDLIIHNTTSLDSLDGFHNLLRVDGEIRITLNGFLDNLVGFEKLNHIGKGLIIRYNNTLDSIQGFDSIQYLPKIDLFGNNDLVSIKGFGKVTSIGELEIKNNEMLNNCCFSLPAKNFIYEENKPGCNSKVKVKELCSANK